MLSRTAGCAGAQYFVDAKVSEIYSIHSRQGNLRVVVGSIIYPRTWCLVLGSLGTYTM